MATNSKYKIFQTENQEDILSAGFLPKQTNLVIGIDPAKEHPSFCQLTPEGDLVRFGWVNLKAYDLWLLLFRISKHVFIEDQYFSITNKATQYSVKAIIRATGKLEQMAYIKTCSIRYVQAKTWQSKLLQGGNLPKKELKKLSLQEANKFLETFKMPPITDNNLADAINIARWAIKYKIKNKRASSKK